MGFLSYRQVSKVEELLIGMRVRLPHIFITSIIAIHCTTSAVTYRDKWKWRVTNSSCSIQAGQHDVMSIEMHSKHFECSSITVGEYLNVHPRIALGSWNAPLTTSSINHPTGTGCVLFAASFCLSSHFVHSQSPPQVHLGSYFFHSIPLCTSSILIPFCAPSYSPRFTPHDPLSVTWSFYMHMLITHGQAQTISVASYWSFTCETCRLRLRSKLSVW